MNNFRTPDQIKQNYIQLMGEPLGTVFNALWQEVARLNTNWSQYVELYGTKQRRVDVLNRAAPVFFRIVQDALWEQTLLHVARLTDPSSTGGKSNLTIHGLPDLIDDQATANEVRRLVSEASKSCQFCRDWRNRRIAHSDLELVIGEGARPLEAASADGVCRALESLTEVLNAVTRHYRDSETFFDGMNGEDAVNLLYIIDDGLREREQRRARKRKREYTDDDFAPPSL